MFTADHGESLGEHGYYFEHGDFVYEASMQVPLILHWPGTIAPGGRIAEPVTLLDLLPTLLGLAGLESPEGQGEDLGPAIRGGEKMPSRVLFGESGSALMAQNPYRAIGGTLTRKSTTLRYVREGSWVAERRRGGDAVLLFDAASDPGLQRDLAAERPEVLAPMAALLEGVSPFAGRWRMAREGQLKLMRIPEARGIRWELYDLEADPREEHDLAERRPEDVARLREHLERWRGEIPEELAITDDDDTLDPQLEERLRALGYVD